MKIMKTCVLTFLFFIFCFSQANAKQSLTFGIDLYLPPFVQSDANGNLYGFDVELVQLICKEMQVACTFKPMPFYEMFRSLQNNEVDALIGSIVITDERKALFNFTVPYLPSEASYVGRIDLPNVEFVTPMYLQNKTVGFQKESIFNYYFKENLPQVKTKTYNTTADIMSALINKKVDLVYLDAPVAGYWVNQNQGVIKQIGGSFLIGYGIGIAVRQHDLELLNQLNTALVTLMQSENYKDLINKYFQYFKY